MRYFTTPSVRSARQSVAWSLFFHLPAVFHRPGAGDFDEVAVAGIRSCPPASSASPSRRSIRWTGWTRWSSVGFLKVSDANGDGILQINEFFMRTGIVVLATPEIAGLPYVISGLVAAGGMAAAMSTADGLLLAIANALEPRSLLQDH